MVPQKKEEEFDLAKMLKKIAAQLFLYY